MATNTTPRFSTAPIKQKIISVSELIDYARNSTPFIAPYALEKLYNSYSIYCLQYDPADKGYLWKHYDLDNIHMAIDLLLFKVEDQCTSTGTSKTNIGYILANGKGVWDTTSSYLLRYETTTVTYHNKHINVLEPFARTFLYPPKNVVKEYQYKCSESRTNFIKSHNLMLLLLHAYYSNKDTNQQHYLQRALQEFISSNQGWPTPLDLFKCCLFTSDVEYEQYEISWTYDYGGNKKNPWGSLQSASMIVSVLKCDLEHVLNWQPNLLFPGTRSGIRIIKSSLRHVPTKRIFFIPVKSITDNPATFKGMLMAYLKALIRRDNVFTRLANLCQKGVYTDDMPIEETEYEFIHAIFLKVEQSERYGNVLENIVAPRLQQLSPPPCIRGLFDPYHKAWDHAIRYQLAYVLSSVAELCGESINTVAEPYVVGLKKRKKCADSLNHFQFCLNNKKKGMETVLADSRKCKHRKHPTVNDDGIACPYGGDVNVCLAARHNTNTTLNKDNATISLVWTQSAHAT